MTKLTTSYWPATTEYPLLDTTCGGVLREIAAKYPDAIALKEASPDPFQRRSWTYKELLNAAEKVACQLIARFEPGTHLGVWGGNCPEWVIVQFGMALSGMVMVTINPAYQLPELCYALKQSDCRGIFYQPNYRGTSLQNMVEDACASPDIELQLVLSFDQLANYMNSSQVQALPDVPPHSPAMIQYTSGTTGSPKGAVLTHYNVTNNSRIKALLKNMDRATINLAIPPLFHTGGCVGGVLSTVQSGGTVLLPEGFNADFMLDLVEQEKVTYLFGVPTMLIAMLEAQREKPRDLSTLKTVFTGGTIVPIDIVRQIEAKFDVCLIIGYGMTETSPAITYTRLTDSAQDKSETIGFPIPQIEVKIIDPETGETLPVNQSGEMCTRGFHVMPGYYNMPEATAKTIDKDGWLHTGDLCAMDERGYCRVTGRLKDMIIRGGENIYPREIEEILYTHPAVAEAAVVGIPDDYWGEQIAGVITLKGSASVDGESLKEFVRTKLARYKTPVLWYALDSLPMTVSGKLQKFRLVEQIVSGELDHFKI
ncbi:MAG: AMP-binding protein [Porticoccaceae bacterium]